MKLCKTGFHFLLFGGSAWLFWRLLSYYGLPDWFERDAVHTMFTIWKWVGIAEMVIGGICFFEAGRQALAGDKTSAEKDDDHENESVELSVEAKVGCGILQIVALFCLVLILAHWVWFAVFLSIALGLFCEYCAEVK